MTTTETQVRARVHEILAEAGVIELSSAVDAILAAASDEDQALALAQRAAAGEPVGYVLGTRRFMGLDLLAAPGALSPREETELLGETAAGILARQGGEPLVIDMCCGSGNLACGLASRVPGARIWASDLTDGCVDLARRNVSHLGLEDRVTVVQGDLFAALADRCLVGRVDVIVCNPPYISTGRLEKDRADLLAHEPREAFDAGPFGLGIHMRLVREAVPFLRPGGWLLCEFGHGQEKQVEMLFRRQRVYEEISLVSDAEGAPRVAMGRLKSDASEDVPSAGV